MRERDYARLGIKRPHAKAGRPMMHLRRHQTDGMFDRFSAHVEELWSRGRDIREAGPDAQA